MSNGTWELARAKFTKMEEAEFDLVKAIGTKYGLDPLIGEIVVYRHQGEIKVFTTRDGYLGIAHRTGQFDRINSVIIAQDTNGDIKEVDILPKGWTLIGAKTYLYKVGNPNPLILSAAYEEYYRPKTMWDKLGQTMIKKVAESQALRKAFNICGVYALEERDSFDDLPSADPKVEAVKDAKTEIKEKKIGDMTEEEKKTFIEPTYKILKKLAEKTGENYDELKAEYLAKINANSCNELTVVELRKLYSIINADLKNASLSNDK